MSRPLLYTCFLLSCISSLAQTIPVGSWRNHFSFEHMQQVVSEGNRTFAASDLALFLFEDDEVTTLSKLDGLNGGAITGLFYEASQDVLLIGYEDGNIDLIMEGKLTSLADLAEGNFGTRRGINDFELSGDRAYAATEFGIATINLNTREITEIFREIGPNGAIPQVNEVLLNNGIFYAATPEGVLIGNQNSNLLDFNNWTLQDETTGLQNLTAQESAIFSSRERTIFRWNAVTMSWEAVLNFDFPVVDLASSETQFYILGHEDLVVIENGVETPIALNHLSSGQSLAVNQETVYVADSQQGLIRLDGGHESRVIPNGPKSDDIAHIKFLDSLFVFYSPPPTPTIAFDSSGYSVFSGGRWNNRTINGFYNITDVASFNADVFLSSNTNGLFDLSQDQLVSNLFSEETVTIPGLSASFNGLFAIRFDHPDALYRYFDDQWTPFSAADVGSTNSTKIDVSLGGVLWLQNQTFSGNGAYAYDIENNQSRLINTSDGLPSSAINDVAIDLDDQAWIATASGVSFFVDATLIFDNNDGFTPIFDGRVLFEDQEVTAMGVDGGNRKWMATKDGIWIFDRNVTSLDQRFTVANSPLPSNNVLEFAYDQNTGEMFILTDRGLVSYRSPSSAGERRHSNVQIFPNPVRPQDTGPVSISGLVTNANVKITDVQGNLVRELEALGGTAAWNLLNTQGDPVNSGVYLFFSSSRNGEETFVGKIAVVR